MCTESNETYVLERSVAIAHAVCSLTLTVLGTLGNGLSIFLIFRGRLHTAGLAMVLLVDLCVTNMVTSAFVLPLIGINNIQGGDWLYGDDFCAAYGFIMYLVLTNEMGAMMLITVNQYLIVVHNFNTQNWLKTHKKLKLIIILFFPCSPSLVYIAPLTRQWDAFGYEPRKGYCTLLNLSGSSSIRGTLNLAFIMTIAAVIVFCYSQIYWKNHKSRVRTDTTTLTLNNTATTTAAAVKSSSSAPRQGKRKERSHYLLRMITLVLVNFFITYIPFIVRAAVDPCLTRTSAGLMTAILYTAWSHVAMNPLIYAFANRQIQSQWRRLLPCYAKRSVPFTTAVDSNDGDEGGKGGARTTAVEDTIAVLGNGQH